MCVCLSFPVSIPWPHLGPLVSDAAWRRLTERSQPAEQGEDLWSPSGASEEWVQFHGLSPFGRSGSQKCPKRQATTGEKMCKQSLWVSCARHLVRLCSQAEPDLAQPSLVIWLLWDLDCVSEPSFLLLGGGSSKHTPKCYDEEFLPYSRCQ